MKILTHILLLLFLFINNSFSQTPDGKEMRGVWIATVKNLDYPSNAFLTTEEQKKEFINLLDYFNDIGINAVFFQVRPAADAFFPSEYEPWSEWLTGKQGKAPYPFYDPLEFMIKECHKRNMQFHAWINPFRAVATIEFADISENHITKTKPEWFFTYGINKYFDPGIPEVRNYITKIIADIVRRYDIDGIHFDDYFYPYPVRNKKNKIVKIQDDETFKKYGKNFENIEDWRRNNLNLFIKQVNKAVKKEKPYVSFGVAPSGVWRNKSKDPSGSNTRGLAHYDYLFSDVIKWLKEGWIDYVAPQLYWPAGNKYADYKTLADWWSKNTYGKQLYIGHAVYNAGKDAVSPAWRNPDELPRQIRINRQNPLIYGSIFYRAKSMLNNPLGFCDSLKNNYYKIKTPAPEIEYYIHEDTSIIADTRSDTISKNDINPAGDEFQHPENIKITGLGKRVMISWDKKNGNKAYKVYKTKPENASSVEKYDLITETRESFIILKRKRLSFLRKEYALIITENSKPGKNKKIIYVKL